MTEEDPDSHISIAPQQLQFQAITGENLTEEHPSPDVDQIPNDAVMLHTVTEPSEHHSDYDDHLLWLAHALHDSAGTRPPWPPWPSVDTDEQDPGTGILQRNVDIGSQLTLTDDGILRLWRAIGEWKKIRTDVDVARFLLSLYFNPRPVQPLSDNRCVHCSSLLTLCCLTCLLSAQQSAPPDSPASARSSLQETSPCTQDRHDESNSNVAAYSEADLEADALSACVEESSESCTSDSVNNIVNVNADNNVNIEKFSVDIPDATTVLTHIGPDTEPGSKLCVKVGENMSFSACHSGMRDQSRCSVRILQKSHTKKHTKYSNNHAGSEQKKNEKYPICDGVAYENGEIPAYKHFSEFKCSKCENIFKKKISFMRHMQSPDCECKICGESFYTMNLVEISKHMKSHQEVPVTSLCPVCGVTVRGPSLTHHMATHTDLRPFTCPVCQKAFKRRTGLQRHKVKHEEKLFQCEICGDDFHTVRELQDHKAYRHQGRCFQCEECGKQLSKRHILANHVRIVHKNDKQHVCSYCGRSHFSLSELRVHMRMHTGEKPYKCKLCPSRFAQIYTLKQHIRTHTGEKPFSCGDCSRSFICRTSLTIHRKRLHSDKVFACGLCGETFPLQSSVDYHCYNKHGGIHPSKLDHTSSAVEDDVSLLEKEASRGVIT